jgi:hypothetical protein
MKTTTQIVLEPQKKNLKWFLGFELKNAKVHVSMSFGVATLYCAYA